VRGAVAEDGFRRQLDRWATVYRSGFTGSRFPVSLHRCSGAAGAGAARARAVHARPAPMHRHSDAPASAPVKMDR